MHGAHFLLFFYFKIVEVKEYTLTSLENVEKNVYAFWRSVLLALFAVTDILALRAKTFAYHGLTWHRRVKIATACSSDNVFITTPLQKDFFYL